VSNRLYDYASRNWGHHAREASTLIPEVISFLERRAQAEASSQALLAVKRYSSHSAYGQEFPRQMTGVHLVAFFGVDNAARLLLGSNSPDVKDSYGQTPLWWAAENGHEAVVKLLLAEDGVDPDSKDTKYSQTPLWCAAENGHEAVVKLLVAEDGVDPNFKDTDSRTPLSWTAVNGHEEVVKLLLVKDGVDLDFEDTINGQTPLSWAGSTDG
jgi:ankyrin repeat protein